MHCNFINGVGIVLVEPFGDFGMIGMVCVGQDGEHVVEPWDAAAILRRCIAFPAEIAGISCVWIALTDVSDDQPVFPIVPAIIDVIDTGAAGFQDIAQADLGGVVQRTGSPILVGWQAIAAVVQGEFPEMIFEPAHGDLDDVM